MLALSGKVKTPPPKKTQVSLETTLHKVDFKKNLYSRETERKKKKEVSEYLAKVIYKLILEKAFLEA